jgi:hexosaminidase
MLKRVFAVMALTVLGMAAPAFAQQYPPSVNFLTISDATPSPGETVTLTGQTFLAGSTVTLTLHSEPVVLGSATADAAGKMALQATIPSDTPLGAHTITADGTAPDGSPLSLSVSLTVVPAAANGGTGANNGNGNGGSSGNSGNLPRTGSEWTLLLAKLGIGLAAAGGVVTAVAAKRRKSALVTAGPSDTPRTPGAV